MPRGKKKKELTLDAELVSEFTRRQLALEREMAASREDISTLQSEMEERGLNVRIVKIAIRLEKTKMRANKAGASDDDIDTLIDNVRKHIDITDA